MTSRPARFGTLICVAAFAAVHPAHAAEPASGAARPPRTAALETEARAQPSAPVAEAATDDDRPVDKSAAVLVSPIGLGISLLSFSYLVVIDAEVQLAFSDTIGLSLEPIVIGLPWSEGFVLGGGLVGLRVAPTGSGLDGFYLTPALGGLSTRDSGFVALASLGIGYQWTWHSGFSLLLGGKVGSVWLPDDEIELFDGVDISWFPVAMFDCKLGYAF